MHSSMMRGVVALDAVDAQQAVPWSKMNWVSMVSKSIAPRSSRALEQGPEELVETCRRGSTPQGAAPASPWGFASAAATAVYVSRAASAITAG